MRYWRKSQAAASFAAFPESVIHIEAPPTMAPLAPSGPGIGPTPMSSAASCGNWPPLRMLIAGPSDAEVAMVIAAGSFASASFSRLSKPAGVVPDVERPGRR